MTSFVSKAACRGRRPSQFAGFNGYQRQELVGRLLKERGVARFLVAPDGYGKTCLVLDYAETLFSWIHVMFINAQSPCFIRDLDDGLLAKACIEVDREVRLVIFDDVPALDGYRAELFSKEIDDLLSANCEVIVTCSPASDVYATLQRDRLKVGAHDLLLNDEELGYAHANDGFMRMRGSTIPPSGRVALLVWGKGERPIQTFLRQAFKEPMPADLLLAMTSMFVMQNGLLEHLSAFGPLDLESVGSLLDSYPHLGFDADLESYETPHVDVEDVSFALKKHIALLVERSSFERQEDLAFAWADSLAAHGNGAGRACDVVRLMCPKQKRAQWLTGQALTLVRRGCFHALLACISSLGKPTQLPASSKPELITVEALCRRFLGDMSGAISCAKRIAFENSAAAGLRVPCLLVLARYGDELARLRAMESLRVEGDGVAGQNAGTRAWHHLLAYAWCESANGAEQLVEAWTFLQVLGAEPWVLDIVAAWVFNMFDSLETSRRLALQIDAVERHVRDRLEAAIDAAPDFFTESAGLAMEHAHMNGLEYRFGPLPTTVLLWLRQAELRIVMQKQLFERRKSEERDMKANWMQTHPDAVANTQSNRMVSHVKRNVPVLSIKLFGRFDIAIGDVPIDQKLFRRRNVRTLLVLLTINEGRELPRDSISSQLWPKSSPDIAQKNYYTVWSQLKRALSLPDGTCPYLLRHQYGCSFEERYVQSDVSRFNEICRELLFSQPDIQKWPDIYAEIDRDFKSALMPAEKNNPAIINARNDCRVRLIDALVAGSIGMTLAGNPQWGIWFARTAVECDATREDAYVALMKAQSMAEQRTAAMMTYLKCQRTLADELGVDPSPETQAFYQRLIDAEDQ